MSFWPGVFHPAVGVIQRLERLWGVDRETAELRAHAMVLELAAAGILADVEKDEHYARHAMPRASKTPEDVPIVEAPSGRFSDATEQGAGLDPFLPRGIASLP
jgi:hypothetical protein